MVSKIALFFFIRKTVAEDNSAFTSKCPFTFITKQSIALFVVTQCFVLYRAMLYRGIKHSFRAIKAVLYSLKSIDLKP